MLGGDCKIFFKLQLSPDILVDKVFISGNLPQLGNWVVENSLNLQSNEDDLWVTSTPLLIESDSKLEFRFLYIKSNETVWETLPQNRKYRAKYGQVILMAQWEKQDGKEIIEKKHKSSVHYGRLQNPKKQKIDQQFDPYEQAFDDSSEDDDVIESNTSQSLSSSDDESIKGQKKIEPKDIYQQEYIGNNIRQKQFRNNTQPTENDILYEITDQQLISLNSDDSLIICTYFLPNVIQKKGDTFISSLYEYSFNLHLYKSLTKICCNNRWYGLPYVYDENFNQITHFNLIEKQELQNYLWEKYKQIPIFIDEEPLKYFNEVFCKKLYSPIMNNDVSISQLVALDYSSKMLESFKFVNMKFEQSISKDIKELQLKNVMILVTDYRLLYTLSSLATKNLRLPIALIYNRHFPHIENLKLLPFYEEILNSFLQINLICFSNFNTAQQFFTIIKQIYGIDYESHKGSLVFKYLGRQIQVKLHNPGTFSQLYSTLNSTSPTRQIINWIDHCDIKQEDLLILGIDLYGLLQGINLKFKQFKYFAERNQELIKNAKVKFIQIMIKGGVEKDQLKNLQNEINTLVYPDHNDWCVKLLDFTNPKDIYQMERLEKSLPSKAMNARHQLLKRANIYIQSHFSGSHDFYLLEYMTLADLPSALVSSSSCYYRGLKRVKTYSIFNFQEFSTKLGQLVQLISEKSYEQIQMAQHEAKIDKSLVLANSTPKWLETLLTDLKRVQGLLKFAQITTIQKNSLQQKFAHDPKFSQVDPQKLYKTFKETAGSRVIIIDFQSCTSIQAGYLIDYKTIPHHEKSTFEHETNIGHFIIRAYDQILESLKMLANDPKNHVYILSSGVYNDLEIHFGNWKSINLFAENGYLYKTAETDGQWRRLFKINHHCLRVVKKIMEGYVQKTEGSEIQLNESSIIWKINSYWEEFGWKQANDLYNHLRTVLERFENIKVIKKNNYVEVRPANLNKGVLVDMILQKEIKKSGKPSWFLNIGRGSLDEDMFFASRMIKLNPGEYLSQGCSIYSVSLGLLPSYASYFFKDQSEIINLLQTLAGFK